MGLLLSSMEGSTSGCNEFATAGHLNGMTKKAYATFILSVPEIELQLQVSVGPLSPSAK